MRGLFSILFPVRQLGRRCSRSYRLCGSISNLTRLQVDYGAECHISKRPYTKFRWRPGSDARYKSTIICQEVAKAKNVCQVCLLDLSHNLPVQVRDQLTNAVVEDIPESQVGLEYQLALKESRGTLGKQYKDGEGADNDNQQLNRLSRTQPYYKVCTTSETSCCC